MGIHIKCIRFTKDIDVVNWKVYWKKTMNVQFTHIVKNADVISINVHEIIKKYISDYWAVVYWNFFFSLRTICSSSAQDFSEAIKSSTTWLQLTSNRKGNVACDLIAAEKVFRMWRTKCFELRIIRIDHGLIACRQSLHWFMECLQRQSMGRKLQRKRGLRIWNGKFYQLLIHKMSIFSSLSEEFKALLKIIKVMIINM